MRFFISCLFFCLLGLIGCKKILTFNIDDETTVTIPSTIGVSAPVSLPTPQVQSSSKSTFDNNNTRADLVEDIRLNTLILTITSPSGETFSFLNSIKIFISANGIPEQQIAWKENIDNSVGNQIELETTDNKLDDYVKLEQYDIRTEVVTDETLLQDVDIKINMSFRVTADPF